MKKLLLLGTLLIIANCAAAQKRYLFKKKYLPNHIYKSTGEERLFTDTNINTGHFIVRTLNIETDQKSQTGNIPLKMFYAAKQRFKPGQGTFAQLNPKLQQPISGYTGGEKLNLDKQLSDNDITRIINEFELDISFPKEPLTIGESFTHTGAIQIINIGGLYQMPLTTTYTLLSVKNNIAVFDTKLAMDFNFDWVKGYKAKGTAKGTGTLIFNIAKNYPEYISSDLEMKYSGSYVSVDIVVDKKPTTLRRRIEIKNEIIPKQIGN